jgi:hypothetical protein
VRTALGQLSFGKPSFLHLLAFIFIFFFFQAINQSIFILSIILTLDLIALVILKIFSREFIPIGTVFTGYGVVVLLIAWYRRSEATRLFLIDHPHHPRNNPDEVIASEEARGTQNDDPKDLVFVTSGMTVVLLTIASVFSYITLLVLLYLM